MTCCITLLIGWLWPYLSLFVDPYYWMAVSIPRISVFMYSIMDGCAHTTCSCIRDISGIRNCRFSDNDVWLERVLIKHFAPPSPSDLMLYRASVTQHFFTVPAIPTLPIGGSFPWSISSVMPCKYHHCIPLHESNIPSIDNSLSRDSKTLVFALARVVGYALAPKKKINIEPRAS